jgi:GT2 family glycosyltransferase
LVDNVKLMIRRLKDNAGRRSTRYTDFGPSITSNIAIAVIIPTYNRGSAVTSVLEKIRECNPRPAELYVHIDCADEKLEAELARRFPGVNVLTSPRRLGPGGGRHRCLQVCSTPYAVSFDDDSYPVDSDFFGRVVQLFAAHPRAAIFGASICYPHEREKARVESLVRTPSYVGCGYGIRVAAYRQVRGYLPRPVPYGMEETDVSIQLFAAGWDIYEAGDLRVFHDTELKHHESPEVTAGVIANAGLCAFLNYPMLGWGRGIAQVTNVVVHCIRLGRLRGIWSGILQIPFDCYRNRQHRKPVPWNTLRKFLHFRRTGQAKM